MNSILITGCNRGLGLGLVKALMQTPKPPQHIFATCRHKEQAKELQDLENAHSNIHILEIDLRSYNQYDTLVKEISEITQAKGLNVLFNNAAIAPKSTRIHQVREDTLRETLETNVIVPIMLSKACIPLLKRASKFYVEHPMGVTKAAIINMSSVLGSIKSNADGGLYAYRSSKAALNAATKSLSIDLYPSKILCVSLHPGWVKTAMGGPKAPLEVDHSTRHIVETIKSFNESHNGGFYQYNGEELPW